jgi:hypothetical protein
MEGGAQQEFLFGGLGGGSDVVTGVL